MTHGTWRGFSGKHDVNQWMANQCNNTNNFIHIAPLKTEFTKCSDRQSENRSLKRQYDNRKQNRKAETKAKQDHGKVNIKLEQEDNKKQ